MSTRTPPPRERAQAQAHHQSRLVDLYVTLWLVAFSTSSGRAALTFLAYAAFTKAASRWSALAATTTNATLVILKRLPSQLWAVFLVSAVLHSRSLTHPARSASRESLRFAAHSIDATSTLAMLGWNENATATANWDAAPVYVEVPSI